jgi:hypothetical protein
VACFADCRIGNLSEEVQSMANTATVPLAELYETDETAWLERMAELVRQRRLSDLDLHHLGEFLSDMARRDRREVKSRLAVLLAHLLKWGYQADHRSGSWRGTIVAQQQELADLAGSGVLHNHAEAVLADAYSNAVEQAAAETGLPASTFPSDCPYSLDQLLSQESTLWTAAYPS